MSGDKQDRRVFEARVGKFVDEVFIALDTEAKKKDAVNAINKVLGIYLPISQIDKKDETKKLLSDAITARYPSVPDKLGTFVLAVQHKDIGLPGDNPLKTYKYQNMREVQVVEVNDPGTGKPGTQLTIRIDVYDQYGQNIIDSSTYHAKSKPNQDKAGTGAIEITGVLGIPYGGGKTKYIPFAKPYTISKKDILHPTGVINTEAVKKALNNDATYQELNRIGTDTLKQCRDDDKGWKAASHFDHLAPVAAVVAAAQRYHEGHNPLPDPHMNLKPAVTSNLPPSLKGNMQIV